MPGDLKLSIDENGESTSTVSLSTSYNVIPIWLKIANDNYIASKKAAEALQSDWCDDVGKQKALLMAELTPSMQVIVACGIAFDSLYDMLRPHAKISNEEIEIWKKKRTSRGDQVCEVIRRVYRLNGPVLKEFKKGIKSIISFRDMAVHPRNEIKNACSRPDVPVGVDWKFCAYKYSNALSCFSSTMDMFAYLFQKKCKIEAVDAQIENIFLSLEELGVAKICA